MKSPRQLAVTLMLLLTPSLMLGGGRPSTPEGPDPGPSLQLKKRASQHFRRGMALIAREQYPAGIAALKEAHAVLPHRDVLYNIARAYSRSGQPSEAIRHFRLYLAYGPPDAPQVEALIRELGTASVRWDTLASSAP